MLSTEQLILIVKDIDDANALDPTIDYDIHGTPHPKELLCGHPLTIKQLLRMRCTMIFMVHLILRSCFMVNG